MRNLRLIGQTLLVLLLLSACAGLQKEDEGRYQLLLNKGRAYLERGNSRMALPSLREARKLRPDDVELLLLLGLTYDREGRPVQALAVLEHAHTLRPKEGRINNNLGVARMRMGFLKQARVAFEAALQDADPARPEETYMNLGLLHKRQGRTQEMIAVLKQAVSINPRYLPAHLELADIYQAMGRGEQERKHLQAVLRVQPTAVSILERLANAHRAAGEKEAARVLWQRIEKVAPGTPLAQRAAKKRILLEGEQ